MTALRFILLITVFSFYLLTYGTRIIFVNTDSIPVPDVNCVAYGQDGDTIDRWVSGKDGTIDTGTAEPSYISVSHPDYNDRIIYGEQLKEESLKVTLNSSIELKEVVVTPSDVEEFLTHTTYILKPEDMARYANVLQSLNEIPNLRVLSNGTVYYEGEENVKILINGVDAGTSEVSTLSKEDISKINVYQNPPLRFSSQGVSAVIDIILKSKIHGGNGGVDITQAFFPLKGNNSAAMYYNYRQSRFSLQYNNDNSHFRKYRRSEILRYEHDGVEYRKTKDGIDSHSDGDDNNLMLTYQVNRPQDFLYNVKAGVDFYRKGGTFSQNVRTDSLEFTATNLLRTDYTKYIIGNYFEKDFGNHGNFIANINYQAFSTFYESVYDEHIEAEGAVNNSNSRYRTRLDAVFSEMQYQLPYKTWGQLSVSAYEIYKHSRYTDLVYPFYQSVNTLGAEVQWLGQKGKVTYFLTMGFTWFHTGSNIVSGDHNLYLPAPRINLTWRVSKPLRLILDYYYTGEVPTIAQLSESNQWLDTRLVYHGNSELKPYKTHSATLRLVFNNPYVNLTWRNNYTSSPDMICDMYRETPEYMLQTLVNLDRYSQLTTQLDISVLPLGNNKLVFWNRIILSDVRGKNADYSWNGRRFQWMSDLALNLRHWTLDLYYQYPGKLISGQLIRPRAQCWWVTLQYRPNTNLSVGLQWFMPFGNGFKESELTVKDAPVQADTETLIRDWSNMLSIKLSYNFSFGRNRNKARPQYDNYDNDSGLLSK